MSDSLPGRAREHKRLLELERALLKVAHDADTELASQLRSVLKRDDDYQSPGKPACGWDDDAARLAG